MAKWSALKHGLALDFAGDDVSSRTNGSSDTNCAPIDDRLDDSEIAYIDGLRSLFYKVLEAFLKDVADRACIHPVLAKIGNGQLVDLFELYCTVRRRGGYGAVCRSCEWGSVAQELGFDRSSISSLKLMHFKYLSEFDMWLRYRSRELFVENKRWESFVNDFGSLSIELETGLEVFAFDRVPCENETKVNHQVKIGHEDDESLEISGVESQKRRRESLEIMLLWINDVAKHPNDPGVHIFLEQSKLRKRALLARDSLFLRRSRQSNSGIPETPPQKKPKVHTAGHLDHRDTSARGKIIPNLAKSSSSMPSYSLPVSQCQSTGPKEHLENCIKVDGPERSAESNPNRPPIGPPFQAEVPEWTGLVSESDPKWLGTKVWPRQNDMGESLGRGRANSCSCPVPGSAECVSFHIAETRMRLKLQLGYSIFHEWRFNFMGEEVSLKWTTEEETRFKDIVRSSQGKCFWDELFMSFRKKSREDLVSYYFNVFLLRQRRYQNRVTPKEIDSDDDEKDFGSFGNCLVHTRARISEPFILNEQCTEIDECVG